MPVANWSGTWRAAASSAARRTRNGSSTASSNRADWAALSRLVKARRRSAWVVSVNSHSPPRDEAIDFRATAPRSMASPTRSSNPATSRASERAVGAPGASSSSARGSRRTISWTGRSAARSSSAAFRTLSPPAPVSTSRAAMPAWSSSSRRYPLGSAPASSSRRATTSGSAGATSRRSARAARPAGRAAPVKLARQAGNWPPPALAQVASRLAQAWSASARSPSTRAAGPARSATATPGLLRQDRGQDVADAQHPEELAAVVDHQVADAPAGHHLGRLDQVPVGPDGDHVGGHELLDADRLGVVGGRDRVEDVALGQDPDQHLGVLDDGRADPVLGHQLGRLPQRLGRAHRHHRAARHVPNLHGGTSIGRGSGVPTTL